MFLTFTHLPTCTVSNCCVIDTIRHVFTRAFNAVYPLGLSLHPPSLSPALPLVLHMCCMWTVCVRHDIVSTVSSSIIKVKSLGFLREIAFQTWQSRMYCSCMSRNFCDNFNSECLNKKIIILIPLSSLRPFLKQMVLGGPDADYLRPSRSGSEFQRCQRVHRCLMA